MKYVYGLLIFIFSFFLPAPALAQNDVQQDMKVVFELHEDGTVYSKYSITLTNLFTEKYAESYKLSVRNANPINAKYIENGRVQDVEVNKNSGESTIKVDFVNPAIGRGQTKSFEIVFSDDNLVNQNGEVWEVSLPIITNISEVDVSYEVHVPSSYKDLAYISPQPNNKIESTEFDIYYFDNLDVNHRGVSLAFGKFQVFNFNFTYHLENPVKQKSEIELAIPPDTEFQRVIYQKIDPKPKRIYVSDDGNYIAVFGLDARERVDVNVSGSVQLYPSRRGVIEDNSEKNIYLLPSEYWQVNDPKIAETVSRLSDVEEIYDFVVNTLSYDYDRVRPNIKRKGAVSALSTPDSSICMEFTDLFIALARAKGIPAREINGYAYTENQKLQPLSLVADVLHSWPEYWDEERKLWIPVDPTWEKTTGGEDFFNKLDLRHFTFVIHGSSPTEPYPPGSYKLGANPQKDVYVSFGELPETREVQLDLSFNPLRNMFFGTRKYEVKISNNGNIGNFDTDFKVYFDDELKDTENIAVIAPFGEESKKISVPFGLTGINAPKIVRIEIDNEEISIPTNKELVMIIFSLIVLVFVFGFSIILFRFMKKRR